jgi:two-component system NarL family response regulator
MTKPRTIRLLLVDDHFVVRMGLASSLNLEADMEVVAECGKGEQAVELFRKHQPDVTLMDWRLPGMSGVATTATIRREFPEARIVMLSAFEGEEDIHSAVQAGVSAYLPKSVEREELLRATRAVHAGSSCFPPAIAAKLKAHTARPELSPRELEVLRLVVQGRLNKEIADALGLAEITIKQHVSSILNKLGVADRTQAATAAIQRGIVHLE